jgi:hypothetical protein
MNVVARYLKFLPQGYNSHPSMRVGFSAGTSTISTILPSSCLTCPANSASNAGRTGCVANAGYYNLDASLLAYFPFRPENIYADASGGGYTLTDTNGALYKPQSEFMTGPFAGAGVALLDNNNILDSTGQGAVSRSASGPAWMCAHWWGQGRLLAWDSPSASGTGPGTDPARQES